MHGLAAALFQLGKNDEARALDEELLPIRKRVLGPEHPETLATINSLANTWRHDGNVEKAKPLYEQVLTFELRDQPDHPRTFVTMDNLAYIYRFLEQNDRATEMRRRIMEGRVRVLGMAHPFTLHSIGDYFDSAQTDHRNWEEARSVLEQLLNRSRRELEPDSEAIASLTGWLANTLVLLDRIDQAVSLVDGLPENRQALGARDDLACFLYSCEARDAALVQFQRVEALRPRLVPADDPDGLVFRTRLALVLREHGRFAEARCVLEQTLAEAHRLREKAAQPNAEIEMMRGIAQLLLGRWPGLAPGVSPEQRPAASFAIDAPFRTTSLVADGRIAPGEYGPGVEATFDGDTNPGRLYLWYKSRSKTPDDLSVRVYSAHNDRSLFLAFLVRDQFVDAGEIDAKSPQWNDAVEVYINGDSVANDLTTVLLPSGTAHGTAGNREGFQLIADAGGHQRTGTTAFTNADWKVGTSRTADGYIIEFEIPLALIDTRDGPEYAPATGGDELRVNFGFVDVDAARSTQTDYGIFWAEDPALSPFFGGEDFWTVGLRLVPKPAKSQ
jgi:tetratricopeptide (TPR) repeat protein